jgi:hypothetical protein
LAFVAGCFIEIEQTLREERVIVEKSGNSGLALAIAAEQNASIP